MTTHMSTSRYQGATRHIAMADIDKAVVQVEFPKETG